MKVIYKKTIMERIIAVRADAIREGREIECFRLTPQEKLELSRLAFKVVYSDFAPGTIFGIPFEVDNDAKD